MTPTAMATRHARHALLVAPTGAALSDLRRSLQALPIDVSTAHTASASMELALRHQPEIVIVDLELCGREMDLRFVETLRGRGASIVFTTARRDPQALAALARFGASAVLRKPIDPRQLELTVLVALEHRSRSASSSQDEWDTNTRRGEASPALLEEVMRRIAAEIRRLGLGHEPAASEPDLLASLRPREQQVVRLLLRHYRAPAIARELGISPQTVRNHLKHVFRQLGVHSQQELLERIIQVPAPGTANALSHHGHPRSPGRAD